MLAHSNPAQRKLGKLLKTTVAELRRHGLSDGEIEAKVMKKGRAKTKKGAKRKAVPDSSQIALSIVEKATGEKLAVPKTRKRNSR